MLILSKEGVKICSTFYVIFEHFRRGLKNLRNFCKIIEIFAQLLLLLLKIGQFWLDGRKSPKFRWRFLQKSGRQLDPKNRPFGEKSPQLGTLFTFCKTELGARGKMSARGAQFCNQNKP